jgi:serine/threonine protein kinase
MGEVYRARDPKLNRDVAIKVLPTAFSSDTERLRRFEQEAQATGALNHPNILAIYDVDIHNGSPYVVSELLEGETLREQIGTLTRRKALDYALQLAHGLVAAHGRGIVHRDLKPDNIFVTREGRVKILDFGLAKLVESSDVRELETDVLTKPLNTKPGTIVGTTGYMSPEQVRGQRVDHRSDIFAFGAVLYEMLSGRRAFKGETAVETLNAILKEDPSDLCTVNAEIDLALERIVRHCLEKSPDERFQSARDLAFALDSLSSSSTSVQTALTMERSRVRKHLPWIAAVLLLLTTIVFAALFVRRGTTQANAVRFLVYPPNKGIFPWQSGMPSAISPDGQWLALTVLTEGRTQLFVRSLDSSVPKLLEGTEDAQNPFWSPDSRSIGFFAHGSVKRVEVTGGFPQTICVAAVPKDLGSGTWGRDGTILFLGPGDNPLSLSLFRVPAAGGEPTLVTEPNSNQIFYFWPHFLPDGRHFLLLSIVVGTPSEPESKERENQILIGSLDSKETKSLLQADSRAVYAPPGYLLYVREGILLAHPFDADKLTLTGEPFKVAESLLCFKPIGLADFSVSANGVLAYAAATSSSTLVWYNRDGAQVGTVGAAADYNFPRLSPDGGQLAVSIREQRTGTTDVWLFDLATGIQSRFTFDPGAEDFPVWSKDGRQIAFAADKRAPPYVHVKALGDAGSGEPITEPGFVQIPLDWTQTAEGQFIMLLEGGSAKAGDDLMLLPLFGDRKPQPFLNTQFNESDARFSPDGKWVAYVSNESGRNEVYVRALKGSGEKWKISTDGGSSPRWRQEKELFYMAADGRLMVVPLKTGTSFARGTPTPLFHTDSPLAEYDVAADGRRLLVNTGSNQSVPVTVVMNWLAGLNR